jgi:hypothetical protein
MGASSWKRDSSVSSSSGSGGDVRGGEGGIVTMDAGAANSLPVSMGVDWSSSTASQQQCFLATLPILTLAEQDAGGLKLLRTVVGGRGNLGVDGAVGGHDDVCDEGSLEGVNVLRRLYSRVELSGGDGDGDGDGGHRG